MDETLLVVKKIRKFEIIRIWVSVKYQNAFVNGRNAARRVLVFYRNSNTIYYNFASRFSDEQRFVHLQKRCVYFVEA